MTESNTTEDATRLAEIEKRLNAATPDVESVGTRVEDQFWSLGICVRGSQCYQDATKADRDLLSRAWTDLTYLLELVKRLQLSEQEAWDAVRDAPDRAILEEAQRRAAEFESEVERLRKENAEVVRIIKAKFKSLRSAERGSCGTVAPDII